jgi:uncharacterized repeat protein (TIGR03803 family)
MTYQQNGSSMSRIQLTTGACVLSVGLALTAFAAPAQAKGYKQLYAFQGGTADGAEPETALLAYKGDFYGTTCIGGAYGAGTIFKLAYKNHKSTETRLYSFTGGSDGSCPGGPLVADKSGNFYDAAYQGGGSTNCSGGCGTAFKFTPVSSTLTVLHTFQGGSDGAIPNLGVIIDKKGNLYGTTTVGGGGNCNASGNPPGCGTVFKVTSGGTETVLYPFQGGTGDGALPFGNLVADSSGNLYGTTFDGGLTTCVGYLNVVGCGTVFKLAPLPKRQTQWTESVLYYFCSQANCGDGAMPDLEPLILDENGNLYGTTYQGGANYSTCGGYGCGTVFELAPNGTESVLYSFCSLANCSDGADPGASLIFDGKGNLYSTTQVGGSGNCSSEGLSGCGIVFKLAPKGKSWTETVLHSFAGGSDGAVPAAGLIADKPGNLYSTTVEGGSANCSGGCGTIFKVKE